MTFTLSAALNEFLRSTKNEEELWRHSRIQIHAGKTQIWNSGGHVPIGVDDILRIAQVADPDARVWFGDHALPFADRGIRVLGTPLGHWSYVQAQLRSKAASHRVLLERIPVIQDLQSAWLLLFFCASPRANNFLRVVHPISSQNEHDQDIWRCFSTLLGQVSGFDQWEVASVPQCLGGLCAARRAQHQLLTGPVGQTAWACSVNDTGMSLLLLPRLTDPPTHAHHLQGAANSRGILHSVGFETAEWAALADGLAPDNLRSKTLSQEFPLTVGNSLLPGPFEEHFVSSSIVLRLSPTDPFAFSGPVPWRASRSPRCLPPLLLGFALSSSVFSSFVAYGFPSPCLLAPAGVAVHSTSLAIIVQRARGRGGGSLEVVGSRWRVRQPGFVGKVEVAWPQTCAWKWCAMGCLCSRAKMSGSRENVGPRCSKR